MSTQIKTNDALVVGIFKKKGSKQEGEFRQVAKDMAPDGGILFAVTYDEKIAKKYLDDEPPAVAAFTNFDPETGLSKKHVKGKAFSTEFEYAALYKWVYAEALPCVTRIPINMGPDASKRNRVRLTTAWQWRLQGQPNCDCKLPYDLNHGVPASTILRRLLWVAAYQSYFAFQSRRSARTRRRRTLMVRFFG